MLRISGMVWLTGIGAGVALGAPDPPPPRAAVPADAIARWTFEADPAAGVRDVTGNGHDGTVVGRAESCPGVSGRGIRFARREGHVAIPDSPRLRFPDGTFSVCLRFNPYDPGNGKQMLAGKSVYADNRREWSLLLDDDGRIRFHLRRDGRWHTIASETRPAPGRWCETVVVLREGVATLYVGGKPEATAELGKAESAAAPLTLGGLLNAAVPDQRFAGALDDVSIYARALSAEEVAAMVVPAPPPHDVPPLPKPFALWDETVPFPPVDEIPLPAAITHVVVHRAVMGEYAFLHGAAVTSHRGTLFASWANSPVEENSPGEIQRLRRSKDGGLTWSPPEVVAPGFEGPERHSHGVFALHEGRLWAFAARFGIGEGTTFPGLRADAFVLDGATGAWEPRGTVMEDCWPYDEPKRLPDGNFITGGQDRNQYPVVAISRGADFTRWDTVKIPVPADIPVSFAETTVLPEADGSVLAIIRPAGLRTALVSRSLDRGRTWDPARFSNFPMAGSKPYACMLSTGQRCLVANWPDRNTLIIATTRPGERLFSRVHRIRHGGSPKPRGTGRHASPQWSYPYACEVDGRLYVVYSIAKEDCGLSIIPLTALANP